ncbi:MAG: T9SS type A sorting domain-containing protein, partial [Bacteroidota bacterium]
SNLDGLPFSPFIDVDVSSFTFRAIKYAPDYEAFTNRGITPGETLEVTPPNIDNCSELLRIDNFLELGISVYPNPTSSIINIDSKAKIEDVYLFSLNGKHLSTFKNLDRIDLSDYNKGIYILRLKSKNGIEHFRIIKE